MKVGLRNMGSLGTQIIDVDQEKAYDAGVIKFRGKYYIFDSRRSTPMAPRFIEQQILDLDNGK
jgi:hypothetical protein